MSICGSRGLNIGVVPADCRELSIRRTQARPFQIKQGAQSSLVLQHVGEAGLAVDNHAVLELLATSTGARVNRRVSAQIVAGVAGNPLALVELAGN